MPWGRLGTVAVIDVETTGLDPNSDRIVSVAVIRMELDPHGEKLRGDSLTAIVDPGRPIPRKASRVNGLKDKDVAGKPVFADEAREIRDFIGDCELVGHNVSFDKRFLSAEFKRAGVETLHRNRSHCTMLGACDWLAEITGWWSSRRIGLERAMEIFDPPNHKWKAHDALEDAKSTARLATRLCQLEVLPKSRTAGLRRHIRDHASTRKQSPTRRLRHEHESKKRRRKSSKPFYRRFWFWVCFLLVWAWLSSD